MAKKDKQKNDNRLLIICTAVIVILFFVPILVSYTNFYPPFLSKKVIYVLDSIVADIPLLPKTPKQIMTKSLIRNQSLQSYKLSSSLSLKSKTFNLVDFSAEQKINQAGSYTALTSSKIKGNIYFLPGNKIDFETRKRGSTLYFKITKAPDLSGISQTTAIWYKLNLMTFQDSLGIKARNDQEIIDDLRNGFQQVLSDSIDKSLFAKVESFKKVKVNKETFYEVKVPVNPESLKALPILGQSKTDKTKLTLFINEKSLFLTKMNLSGQIVSETKNLEKNSNIIFTLEARLSEIDKAQQVDFPPNVTEIKDSLDLSLKLSKKSSDALQLFTATKSAKDFGENLLTIERLTSVLLLFPKAI